MDIDKACEMFRNKKITLLGLGLLGRAVGDAEFLGICGAEVLVTDKKNDAELAESVEKLKKYKNISFHLGEHRAEDLTGCDFVVKAAGVPLDSLEVAAARTSGVPVYMSTALFAKSATEEGVTIVGVTGTRGKSTIAHLIHHSLIRANKRTTLGGNVRGKSTLALLSEVRKGDIAVLELDSWQLQGFGDLKISPHISVFTNFLQDHVNYYPTTDVYFADKANIFKFQRPDDALIVGAQAFERVQTAHTPCEPFVPPPIPADWKLKILGEHNRENASLAAAALRALPAPACRTGRGRQGSALTEEEIRAGLESFAGVEGRLQFVRKVKGVKIYNDNNATTPEATIAALRAVGDARQRNVVLIVGGDDKNLDMSELVKEIPKWCSKVVLFKERGTERIRDDVLALELNVLVYEEEGLRACVDKSVAIAESGEIILYSPAFSSFGKYFKNEFDRNDQFLALVKAL